MDGSLKESAPGPKCWNRTNNDQGNSGTQDNKEQFRTIKLNILHSQHFLNQMFGLQTLPGAEVMSCGVFANRACKRVARAN